MLPSTWYQIVSSVPIHQYLTDQDRLRLDRDLLLDLIEAAGHRITDEEVRCRVHTYSNKCNMID